MRRLDRLVGIGVIALSGVALAGCYPASSFPPAAAAVVVPYRPPAKLAEIPAGAAITAGALAERPLELDRDEICMDARPLRRTPGADRELDPRLLARGARGLELGRRPVDLVDLLRG